jgi:6-phosphogluconate dehydrogenase
MQLAMVGLGRMGSNMVRRLIGAGHQCVVYDTHRTTVKRLQDEGAMGTESLEQLVQKLSPPRPVWLMVPAASVDSIVEQLLPLLEPDDIVIDGGNSHFLDDIRRASRLGDKGLHYLDVGVSGGVWGLERGYCQMIGGEAAAVERLAPLFQSLAPGIEAAHRTAGRQGDPSSSEQGYLHCGPAGAGHFVKMVHNGIEYGVMAAYAEGFNILRNADAGRRQHDADAETAPMQHPEHYGYSFDPVQVAEVWRRGSVIGSWLLDLTASALLSDPDLGDFAGPVSDSGEGRWTLQAALDEGVPAPVIGSAVFTRFGSQGGGDYAHRILSAMRFQFGGHQHGSSLRGGRS